ncbi:hypothetical protein AB0P21_26025 [Kribbella sp. NPDC056861]|uniref:hypothetical protein n=1 Tax=Kribbella sp. NPDC056861 TaxID=3154857 RepID=UPI00341850A8
MEPLSLVLSVKLVADDMRRSTSGHDEVRRTADEALLVQRREHRLWSALRRVVTRRRASSETEIKEVVHRPRLVAESPGD